MTAESGSDSSVRAVDDMGEGEVRDSILVEIDQDALTINLQSLAGYLTSLI
jgi:hypothetical protein